MPLGSDTDADHKYYFVPSITHVRFPIFKLTISLSPFVLYPLLSIRNQNSEQIYVDSFLLSPIALHLAPITHQNKNKSRKDPDENLCSWYALAGMFVFTTKSKCLTSVTTTAVATTWVLFTALVTFRKRNLRYFYFRSHESPSYIINQSIKFIVRYIGRSPYRHSLLL